MGHMVKDMRILWRVWTGSCSTCDVNTTFLFIEDSKKEHESLKYARNMYTTGLLCADCYKRRFPYHKSSSIDI